MTFVSNISVTASGFLHHVFAEPHATAEIDHKGKTGSAQKLLAELQWTLTQHGSALHWLWQHC